MPKVRAGGVIKNFPYDKEGVEQAMAARRKAFELATSPKPTPRTPPTPPVRGSHPRTNPVRVPPTPPVRGSRPKKTR